MSKKPERKRIRHLLIRYGGLGDALFLTAVAHALRKHGIIPDIALPEAQCVLLQNNPDIGRVYPLRRIGPWGMSQTGPVNCFKDKDGSWKPIECLLPEYATGPRHRRIRVTDYYRIIEGNGCNPSSITGNSDYTNAYDLHLSWAGIDPALIPSTEKRPYYHPTEAELAWARDVLKDVPRPVVLWQPYASAPARSYYRATRAANAVMEKAGGYHLMWDQGANTWLHKTGPIPTGKLNPLRATGALIACSDLLVSADTFVSHLAEAVSTTHLTWYSTVSAWTRSQHYRHELTHDLHPEGADPAHPCKCHVITDARCPLVEQDAIDAISEKDRAAINQLNPQARQQLRLPMEHLPVKEGVKPRDDIHPAMMRPYIDGIANSYHVARHAEPYCLRGFDLEAHVLDAIEMIRSSI